MKETPALAEWVHRHQKLKRLGCWEGREGGGEAKGSACSNDIGDGWVETSIAR